MKRSFRDGFKFGKGKKDKADEMVLETVLKNEKSNFAQLSTGRTIDEEEKECEYDDPLYDTMPSVPHATTQDLSHDTTQDLSRDTTQDLSRDTTQDLSHDTTQDLSHDTTQDLSHDRTQDFKRDTTIEEQVVDEDIYDVPSNNTTTLTEVRDTGSKDMDVLEKEQEIIAKIEDFVNTSKCETGDPSEDQEIEIYIDNDDSIYDVLSLAKPKPKTYSPSVPSTTDSTEPPNDPPGPPVPSRDHIPIKPSRPAPQLPTTASENQLPESHEEVPLEGLSYGLVDEQQRDSMIYDAVATYYDDGI